MGRKQEDRRASLRWKLHWRWLLGLLSYRNVQDRKFREDCPMGPPQFGKGISLDARRVSLIPGMLVIHMTSWWTTRLTSPYRGVCAFVFPFLWVFWSSFIFLVGGGFDVSNILFLSVQCYLYLFSSTLVIAPLLFIIILNCVQNVPDALGPDAPTSDPTTLSPFLNGLLRSLIFFSLSLPNLLCTDPHTVSALHAPTSQPWNYPFLPGGRYPFSSVLNGNGM